MLKVITRYLASAFIPPFVIGLLSFLAFMTTYFMFRITQLIVTKGVDVYTLITIVLNLGISFFPLATPLAAFFATTYTLNKLKEDSEIVAMRSFGLTTIKIYFPFLLISFSIAMTLFSIYSVLIPKADSTFNNTIAKMTSAGMIANIKSGKFFTDIPNVTLFAEKVTDDGNHFNNIFLHVLGKDKFEHRVIFAHEGTLIKLEEFGRVFSIRLHLNDGNIIKMDEEKNNIEKILFQEYDFPVFNSQSAMTQLPYDSMKTNAELRQMIAEKRVNYYNALTKPTKPNELLDLKKTLYRTQSSLFNRYLTLPLVLVFVFLGFSLSLKGHRGNNNNNSSRALIIILSYYTLYFYLLSLASKAILSPYIAIFGPCSLFFLVALRYYRKLDWIE